MTDDMNGPRRRAAWAQLRERAERLPGGMTDSERLARAAELQEAREAQRSGNLDTLNAHYQRNSPLLTGFEPAQAKEQRKLEAAAARFTEQPEMEVFLRWEKAGDPRLDKLDPATRMSMGFYRRDKEAAEEVNRGR